MNKVLVTSLAIGALSLAAGSVSAAINDPTVDGVGAPGTGIVGTAHDLSQATGRASTYLLSDPSGLDRLCVYCHAPHNTIKAGELSVADNNGVDYLPLWNHDVTMSVYASYYNGLDDPNEVAADGTTEINHSSYAEDNMAGPGSVSLLCLSCHDGTVALNAYGRTTGNPLSTGAADTYIDMNTDQYLIGGDMDMSNHHPIGFSYSGAQAVDDEIAPMTTLMGEYEIGDLLWGGNMECTTCHDVHNSKNTGEKFLWISDTNSKFCLTCHLK